MLALANGDLLMACEETGDQPTAMPAMHMDHSHGGMQMNHGPAAPASIILRIMRNGSTMKQISLTDGKFGDNHAVLTSVQNGVLVAWIREENGHSSICYTKLNNSDLTR